MSTSKSNEETPIIQKNNTNIVLDYYVMHNNTAMNFRGLKKSIVQSSPMTPMKQSLKKTRSELLSEIKDDSIVELEKSDSQLQQDHKNLTQNLNRNYMKEDDIQIEDEKLNNQKSSINLPQDDNSFIKIKNLKTEESKTYTHGFQFNKTAGKPNLANTSKGEKSTTTQREIKVDDVASIIKRVLENNKKEAQAKNREFFSNYPQNYMNMNKTKSNFLIGQRSESQRPFTDNLPRSNSTFNSMDIYLTDFSSWKKHEEIWNNISSQKLISWELEKYLIPPNDNDILYSSFFKLHGITIDRFVIDDNIPNSKSEIQKWKSAYKRAILRWHPDKLFPFLEEIKLCDDNRKNILKKKAGLVINNMNKTLQSILEILRKIGSKKEGGI